jgi:hypothetical protein
MEDRFRIYRRFVAGWRAKRLWLSTIQPRWDRQSAPEGPLLYALGLAAIPIGLSLVWILLLWWIGG